MKIRLISTICTLTLGAMLIQPDHAVAQTKPDSAVSLADLNSQLSRLQMNVQTAVSSLNTVKESAKNPADLSKAAAAYDRSFNALQAEMEGVRSNAIAIKATVTAHYETWQKELTALQNPGLREKAQERFSKSQKEFDKIVTKATAAKEQALPFVSQLKDINIYLSVDLSEEAVKSLSGDIWKLSNDSRAVIGRIEDVKEQINRTMQSLPQK
jgi:hypothetical protein